MDKRENDNSIQPIGVFLALGTNLNNRAENLEKAIVLIEARVGDIEKRSAVYETEAWGNSLLNDFYNQVVLVNTLLSPTELLKTTQAIEQEMGRKEKSAGEYNNRIIDIDIIYYGDLVLEEAHLSIPHPLLTERDFVLLPLSEISPQFNHPKILKSTNELVSLCPDRTKCIKIS